MTHRLTPALILATAVCAAGAGYAADADHSVPADVIPTNGAFEYYDSGQGPTSGRRNANNPDVRFGGNGGISIPGKTRANENSVVRQRDDMTDLVRPGGLS